MRYSNPAEIKARPWIVTPIVLSLVVLIVGSVFVFVTLGLRAGAGEVTGIERGSAEPTCRPVSFSPTQYGLEIPLHSIGDSAAIDVVELIEPEAMSIVRASLVETDVDAGSSSENWVDADGSGVSLEADLSGAKDLLLLVEIDSSQASAYGIAIRTLGETPAEQRIPMLMSIDYPACTLSFVG